MRCPRCGHATERPTTFCVACGAPIVLDDDPSPGPLDATLDLDRRGPAPAGQPPPKPGAAAAPARAPPRPPPAAPGPGPSRGALPEVERSHWDLGAIAAAARAEPAPATRPPRNVAAPRPPARVEEGGPARPARAAPVSPPAPGPGPASAEGDLAEVELQEDALEVHLRRAPSWKRAAAWAIDGAPFLAAVVALGRWLAAQEAPRSEADGLLDVVARDGAIVASLAGLLAVALFVYSALAHALAGATVGKWILGIRVAGPGGGRPTLERSAVRSALALLSAALLGLGFIAAFFTRSGRALHDLLAGTYVVERERDRSP